MERLPWNAVLSLAPPVINNRDVLVLCTKFCTQMAVSAAFGHSTRHIRHIQKTLLRWACTHMSPGDIQAHLDDQITIETVARRRPARRQQAARALR